MRKRLDAFRAHTEPRHAPVRGSAASKVIRQLNFELRVSDRAPLLTRCPVYLWPRGANSFTREARFFFMLRAHPRHSRARRIFKLSALRALEREDLRTAEAFWEGMQILGRSNARFVGPPFASERDDSEIREIFGR